MRKFQYTTRSLDKAPFSLSAMVEIANEMADQGWELMQIIDCDKWWTALFKMGLL